MFNDINHVNSDVSSLSNTSLDNMNKTIFKRSHDFDSLTKFLKENGVSDNDIDSLEDLIEKEGEVNLEKGYGKEVKELIIRLISKSI